MPAGELGWIDGQSYDVTVSGSDLAGNLFTVTQVLKADLVAPNAELNLAVGSGSAIAIGNPRFQGPINTANTINAADFAAGVSLGTSAGSDASTMVVSVNGITQSVVPSTSNGATSWSFALDPERFLLPQEGTVAVSATLSDQAGNSATGSGSITIDRSAGLTISDPVDGLGGNSILNTAEAGAVTIAGTTANVQSDGTAMVLVEVLAEGGTTALISHSVPLTSGSWSTPALNFSGLADGTYSLRASVRDGSGNQASASRSFAINIAPPLFKSTVMAGDSILNASDLASEGPLSLSGQVSNAEEGQQVSVTLPGAGSGAGAVAGRSLTATVAGGLWSLQVPADLLAAYGANNGSYTVTLSLSNQAGNSATGSSPFKVDTVGPVLAVTSPSEEQWGAAAADPDAHPITLRGTAEGLEAGQVLTVTINGKALQASRDGLDVSQWSVVVPKTVLKGLNAAANSLQLGASDLAGNPTVVVSSFAAPGINTTPPIIAVPTSRKVTATEGDGLIYQFQANQPVSWSLEGTDSNLNLVDINASTGSFSFRKPISLSDGQSDLSVSFVVIATDVRGNQSRESLELVVRNLADASTAAIVDPLDQDGIAETVEDAATNGRVGTSAGDLNNDGIADKLQPNVAAVPWINKENFESAIADPSKAVANSYTSLQTNAAVRITDVEVRKPGELAVGGNGSSGLPALITTSTSSSGGSQQVSVSYPYDPLVFKLQSYDPITQEALPGFLDAAPAHDGVDLYPGTQVRMVMDLPGDGLLVNTYLKWNPSANGGTGSWFEFLADGDASTYDNGAELVDLNHDGRIDQIRLTYTDGDPLGGDIDGLVNGIIQDPGGPALTTATSLPSYTAVTQVTIVSADDTTQVTTQVVQASFYGASLVIDSEITPDLIKNLILPADLTSLEGSGITIKRSIDFELKLQPGLSQASLYSSIDLVGSDLQLTDVPGRRLTYYGLNNGVALPQIYDPLKKAGARFYNLDNDPGLDFMTLFMINGDKYTDFGDDKTTIANTSAAAFVDGSTAEMTWHNSSTLTVADPTVSANSFNLVLKASLKERVSTSNQIGYIVLNSHELMLDPEDLEALLTPDEIQYRAQTLFSTLESSDVILASNPDQMSFEREILLVNGQSVRFFEVSDGSLEDIKDLQGINDPRLRFFSFAEVTDQQAFLTSSSGVKFQLDLLSSDQGLNALIGQEQGSAAVLDFSPFSGTETVTASLVLAREASYDSVTGFYRTLDREGTVRDYLGAILRPGDEGYRDAALLNMVSGLSNLRVGNLQTITNRGITITESTFLAPIAIVNGDTYFAFGAASSDKLNHFKILGTNLFGLEDMRGLGDRDYDDLVIGFAFS